MYKLIAAFVAVVAAGLAGALIQPQAGAQEETPRPGFTYLDPPRLETARVSSSGFYHLVGADEPGTWQIVELGQHVILLNSANGQTYRLVSQNDNLTWKLIPRPQAPARIIPWVPSPPPAGPDE